MRRLLTKLITKLTIALVIFPLLTACGREQPPPTSINVADSSPSFDRNTSATRAISTESGQLIPPTSTNLPSTPTPLATKTGASTGVVATPTPKLLLSTEPVKYCSANQSADNQPTVSATGRIGAGQDNLVPFEKLRPITPSAVFEILASKMFADGGEPEIPNADFKYYLTTARAEEVLAYYRAYTTKLGYNRENRQAATLPMAGTYEMLVFVKDNLPNGMGNAGVMVFTISEIKEPFASLFQLSILPNETLVVVIQTVVNPNIPVANVQATVKPVKTVNILPEFPGSVVIKAIPYVERELARQLQLPGIKGLKMMPKTEYFVLSGVEASKEKINEIACHYEKQALNAGYSKYQSLPFTLDSNRYSQAEIYINATNMAEGILLTLTFGALTQVDIEQMGNPPGLKVDDILIIVVRIGF